MQIVIDENIPLGREYFSTLGEVSTVNPRRLTPREVCDADLLIVRSVARIDAGLLQGSRVRFIGTCTAGFDHIDVDYLSSRNISWCNAPGCNANAVVEYVFSALSALDLNWLQCRVGVIGCGNVGGLLLRRLHSLGVECVGYDPLLDRHANPLLGSFEQVLNADVVCVHTPLTKAGEYPTYHLLSAEQLKQLKPNAVLINAGRGPVVNNDDLLMLLKQRDDLKVVLDVWEGEPDKYSRELVNRVDVATVHIAGHSYDGKVKGTVMVYQQACKFLGVSPTKLETKQSDQQREIADSQQYPDKEANDCTTDWQRLNQIILAAYDVRMDHRTFVDTIADTEDKDLATEFHRLRKNYRQRLEFCHYQVSGEQYSAELKEQLKLLGFQ